MEGVLDKTKTALLIADFYADVMGSLPHAVDRRVAEKTQALQQAARTAGILLCYCATVFRPGYIEISDRNKTFSQRKRSAQPAVGAVSRGDFHLSQQIKLIAIRFVRIRKNSQYL